MKKLLAFTLAYAFFVGATAKAGRIDEIVIMTDDSIFAELGLIGGIEDHMEVLNREFIKAEAPYVLAVKTQVRVSHIPAVTTAEWTCVTQFVKTPEFFEVSKTDCK